MNRSRISARFCALACASLSILAMAGCTASFTSSSPQSAQTISFAAVGSQTVGATVTLSATASSGLPVSFASESPLVCAVSGTTATMSATGTCVLEAMQTGDSLYLPVNTVEEVAVGGESQTIAFANPGTQTVGTPLTLSATATSGLTVSFASQTTSVCTVSGATAKFLEAGTCTIQATQAGNATYAAATPVSQSFTVNAGSLQSQTITFNNPGTQTVGTQLTLVATASSGLTVSFISQTTSVCTVSGTTATLVASGTCTIQATQAGNTTYAAATPVSQSFTVNAAIGTSGNAIGYSSCPSPAGTGTQFTIGMLDSSGNPSGPQTIAAFTQWNNLNPGDVVCIYGKSTPYAERLVLTRGRAATTSTAFVLSA